MYRRTDRVRFSEMGADGKMRLSSLMDALQDCSDAQSEALGIGYSWLKARNRGWILLHWHVVIDRYPENREEYTVETRPWKFEHFLGHRNFAVYDKDGTSIVKANSRWCFMDTERMRPVRPLPEESGPYGVDPRLDMEYLTEKRIPLPQDMRTLEKITVTKDLLDLNEHVNNVKYIAMADRLLPGSFKTKELKAEYRNAAKEGDVIIPMIGEHDGWQTISLNDENGRIYAVVALRDGE
ncbi:MAG: acyl-[Lachnospiraceae bacterium]|nr:acyl-[acyl-carrier-protein] thioesterase [Lachnospiraceae bacterium]